MSSLADSVILREMKRGNIIIDPFTPEHLNPNSVDLTLNRHYQVFDEKSSGRRYFDCKSENMFLEHTMPDEGMILEPEKLYIYSCNERIGVPCNGKKSLREHIFGRRYIKSDVGGKSSLGRLGLFIHITAGFIDSGFVGSLVLEMVATHPIKIYPNQKICQIEFTRVEGKVIEPYGAKKGSKYMNQKGAQTSMMHKNFEK